MGIHITEGEWIELKFLPSRGEEHIPLDGNFKKLLRLI